MSMTKKSQLDELIDEMRKEWTGNRVDSCLIDGCEYQIRLAVQKHAEAVIPDRNDAMTQYDAYRNHVINEIKSASDKWRGC